ncbi:MAG TPA: ABC transporter permease [Blastocatellia bacterium]|nr:ABC transporter permease [Blastocatellia bacterium]
MKPHLWLIRAIGVIVPRRLRGDWRQEWEAELRNREFLLADWDRLDWRAKADLIRRSIGAFRDALCLQPRRLEDEMFQDLRYGLRMLRKNPGFTAAAVLTLALGIGANTAMFSVLNTYLFRPLPYPNPDRIVRVFRTSPISQSWPHSPGSFFDYRDQNNVFECMAAFTGDSVSLGEPGVPAERVRRIRATVDFFQVLGVQPVLGRVFSADEEVEANSGVVVLSHPYWMRRYDGDPAVIGRTIQLNGSTAKIIGVMPPGVEHPLMWGNIDMWAPQAFSPDNRRDRNNNYLQAVGRLKPGVSIEKAQEAMTVLAASIGKNNPANTADSLRLEPFQLSMSDDVGRKLMWFTFGLAAFVLLIGCANLANLQLVRTSARSREYSVRAALGAGRGRLIRQSLTESLAVSMVGGVFSLALAQWSVEFISRRLFSEVPGAKITLDLRVFGFALLCSVTTGLIFGTVPAWLASRTEVNQALRQNVRGSTVSRPHQRLRNALIAGEVAFALILLTGAGLFLRGLQRVVALDPGWNVDGVVTAQVAVQGPQFVKSASRAQFIRQLEERIGSLPGVNEVAVSSSQLVFGFQSSGPVVIEGQPEPPPGQLPEVCFEPVSTEYFQTLGVSLLRGRAFNSADTGRVVAIINKTMAERFWPDESPIGKRFGNSGKDRTWLEVVGVVSDMYFPANLETPDTRLHAFTPIANSPPWGSVTVTMRTPEQPDTLASSLRSVVGEIDSIQSVYRVQTVRSQVERALGSVSLLGTLLGAFAALGLGLATIGIYGVTSYSVAQRTGEIGIRMALGAQHRDVLWLILKNGARLCLAGALFGVAGGYPLARLLESLIPTLPTYDPVAFVVISVALVTVSLVACYLPARRAARIEPLEALRYE